MRTSAGRDACTIKKDDWECKDYHCIPFIYIQLSLQRKHIPRLRIMNIFCILLQVGIFIFGSTIFNGWRIYCVIALFERSRTSTLCFFRDIFQQLSHYLFY
nr:MAG TPA: hypothetical protein [Caudoviricetes sp.]